MLPSSCTAFFPAFRSIYFGDVFETCFVLDRGKILRPGNKPNFDAPVASICDIKAKFLGSLLVA